MDASGLDDRKNEKELKALKLSSCNGGGWCKVRPWVKDTALVNPGCFADDGSFAVYRPATREVEFSAVP